jgi:hypothetical protein
MHYLSDPRAGGGEGVSAAVAVSTRVVAFDETAGYVRLVVGGGEGSVGGSESERDSGGGGGGRASTRPLLSST